MTIVSAFNDITVAKGGTPNESGTIAGAIDALNDTLAGSDQPASDTIEGAIKRLGENIGGGGYDIAIAITKKDGSEFGKTGWEYEIIDGSYDAMIEKYNAHIAPTISVVTNNMETGSFYAYPYATVSGWYDGGEYADYFLLKCPRGFEDGSYPFFFDWDIFVNANGAIGYM